MKLALALLAFVLAASAAGIDGDWNAELARGKKAAPAQNNTFTLTLKTNQDGKVSGMVLAPGKKKPRQENIQHAVLNGNTLTFTTLQTSKRATISFSWQVTVDGDQMTGTRTREGAGRAVAFKAKRTS